MSKLLRRRRRARLRSEAGRGLEGRGVGVPLSLSSSASVLCCRAETVRYEQLRLDAEHAGHHVWGCEALGRFEAS